MKAGNQEYKQATDLPTSLPMLLSESMLILPGTYVPVLLEQSKQLKLIEDVLKGDKLIGVIKLKETGYEMCSIGCVARITSFSELGEGKTTISLEGVCRFWLGEKIKSENNYEIYAINPIAKDFQKTDINFDAKTFIDKYLSQSGLNSTNRAMELEQFRSVPFDILINTLCVNGNFTAFEQQILLEAENTEKRSELFLALCERSVMKKEKNHISRLH